MDLWPAPDAKIWNPLCPNCKHDGMDHNDPDEYNRFPNYIRIGCSKCDCRYYWQKDADRINGKYVEYTAG